jgi:hypothetical protein
MKHHPHRPTLWDAYHQWQIANLWMKDAIVNPSSRDMAQAMLAKYFAIIEELLPKQEVNRS